MKCLIIKKTELTYFKKHGNMGGIGLEKKRSFVVWVQKKGHNNWKAIWAAERLGADFYTQHQKAVLQQ
jgi:hypothetical protein